MQSHDAPTPTPSRPQSEVAASARALAEVLDWEPFFRDHDLAALTRRRDELIADFEMGGLDAAVNSPSCDHAASNGARCNWLLALVWPPRFGIAPTTAPRGVPPRPKSATPRPAVDEKVAFSELDRLVGWCLRVQARLAHA